MTDTPSPSCRLVLPAACINVDLSDPASLRAAAARLDVLLATLNRFREMIVPGHPQPHPHLFGRTEGRREGL
jgi:hypothetical protein